MTTQLRAWATWAGEAAKEFGVADPRVPLGYDHIGWTWQYDDGTWIIVKLSERVAGRRRPKTIRPIFAPINPEGKPMHRPLYEIAQDIRKHWANVNYAAEPYLKAMADLRSMHDFYGLDPASSVVRYFLSNATTWRGEDARRVKAELKGMLK